MPSSPPCSAVPDERLRLIVESYERLTGKSLLGDNLLLPPCRGKVGMGVEAMGCNVSTLSPSLSDETTSHSTKPASGQVAGYLQGRGSKDLREALWNAPRAIVAHGTEDDPVFFYGNRAALDLFEMEFGAFARLPSRLSAEPLERTERERLLDKVARQGYVDDYRGVRVGSSGRRFMIEAATVWNLADEAGTLHGQAATFSDWRFL